jgi:hypothetical protein
MTMPATRFAGLSRRAAILILTVTGLACAGLLYVALIHVDAVSDPSRGSDREMYERVVGQMRQGVNYYDAARAELSAGGYGMQSVFNWRTPLFPSLLALVPATVWAQAVLVLLALAAGALACRVAYLGLGRPAAISLGVLEVLGLGVCFVPQSVVLSEIPAGVLILLSASAYGLRRPGIGQAAGILALFLRELAAPYVVVCLFLAWRERRWPEAFGWLVALLFYALYFFWHVHMVQLHQSPGDHADARSWLTLGGADFTLVTAAFNGLLLAAPLWVTAILLPLAGPGLLAWPGSAGLRMALTVFGYLALYAIVGKPLNGYWGAIYTPLLMPGLVWAPAALRDLFARLVPASATV